MWWTHQVIKHPHQRLKLQLANLPFVLATHVDSIRCGHSMHSGFVLLLVQHYQVVHATSTRDGIHLKAQNMNRGRSMWASTDNWWLTQNKINRKARRDRNDNMEQRIWNRFPDHCVESGQRLDLPKPKWDTPQSKATTAPRNIQYMTYNKHGRGDLFIEIKLGFAGWINVFFCSTGESQ